MTHKHDGARCSRAYVENISNYYITGQGSLRYRNATESRTRVITVLKAKDYALIAGDLDDRCRVSRIQSRVNALHKSNG